MGAAAESLWHLLVWAVLIHRFGALGRRECPHSLLLRRAVCGRTTKIGDRAREGGLLLIGGI